MRCAIGFILALFFAGASPSVLADDPPPPAEQKASSEATAKPAAEAPALTGNEQDEERVTCRFEKQIGSNRRTRVCRSNAEIEEQSRRTQESMSQGTTTPGI